MRRLFLAHRGDDPAYRDAYGLTANVGCILAGTYVGERSMERYVQARLLLAGVWVGAPDGILGKMTRAGMCAALKVNSVNMATPAATLIGMLDSAGIGLDVLAQF